MVLRGLHLGALLAALSCLVPIPVYAQPEQPRQTLGRSADASDTAGDGNISRDLMDIADVLGRMVSPNPVMAVDLMLDQMTSGPWCKKSSDGDVVICPLS
jgi:hypothetical protein